MIDYSELCIGDILVYVEEPGSPEAVACQIRQRLACGDLVRVVAVFPLSLCATIEVCKDPGRRIAIAGTARTLLAPHIRFEDLPVPDFY